MARYNQGTGMWEAYDSAGRRLGSFQDQASAQAAESGGAGTQGGTTDQEFRASTSGLATGQTQVRPQARITQEDYAKRDQLRDYHAEQQRLSSVAYGTPQAQGGTAAQYSVTQPTIGTINTATGQRNAPMQVARPTQAPAGPGHGVPAPNTTPPTIPGASGQGHSNDLGRAPQMASVDYSRYDQAAQAYARAEQTFMSELDRLSGVDPFGNQAFLQKATDRAVAQARGSAAMQRGGAAAQAGALRQAVGVQSQLAARGAQEMEQVRSRDEVAAGQLRSQAATGLAGVAGQRAQNEVELAKLQTETLAQNLKSWIEHQGITLNLEQRDVENLRNVAVEYSKIDMQRYMTDVDYRKNVDDNITAKYAADKNFQAVKAKIDADENTSFGEFLMGAIGATGGLLGGVAALSDRRAKFDVRDPDLRDLQDFLGTTRAKSYRYKSPTTPGAAPGRQFGFMAQDLAKSKIGRTLVQEGADGLLRVDTGRLALADHAALSELAREVEKLKRRA